MPGAQRDPLSERYDAAARRLLTAAVAAHQQGRRGGVVAFIASPPREFTSTDKGGRTAHERAFTRAAYYLVMKVPQHQGVPQQWSLKLEWGPIERRGRRWGRVVRARLFLRSSGARHAAGRPGSSWRDNPALRSSVSNRIDG
jgi:hypothetical protein